MRGQALIVEYLLILILSLLVLGYSIMWFNSQKVNFLGVFEANNLENQIKFLDVVLENLKYFDNATKVVLVNANYGKCSGPVFIMFSSTPCESTTLNITFQGYVITINNSTYIYDTTTGLYYLVYKNIYSNLLTGCIEGKSAYVINSTSCDTICEKNCKITIKKFGTNLIIR